MLRFFRITRKGSRHAEAGAKCQDRSVATRVSAGASNDMVVAAIADGVGSCDFSDRGAAVATLSAVRYVSSRLASTGKPPDDERVLQVLRGAFEHAAAQVEVRADEEGLPFVLYDSTLTVVVFDGDALWYGHAGDDGVVVMLRDGGCRMVTTRHKGLEVSSVVPLRCSGSWEFGCVHGVASLVMMTDGLLDWCVGADALGSRVYLPFLQPLLYAPMDSEDSARGTFCDWLSFLGGETSVVDDDGEEFKIRDHVTDDITLVLVSNPEAVALLPPYSFDVEAFNEETRLMREGVADALRADADARASVLASRGCRPAGKVRTAQAEGPTGPHAPRGPASKTSGSETRSELKKSLDILARDAIRVLGATSLLAAQKVEVLLRHVAIMTQNGTSSPGNRA